MNCPHCNKWAGPHAVLPGQDDSSLCKCSLKAWAGKNLSKVVRPFKSTEYIKPRAVHDLELLKKTTAYGDCVHSLHKLMTAAYEAGVQAGREQMP